MSALINLGSKVNAMHLIYAKKLGLNIRKTDVKTQKIDSTTLKTFRMVIAAFLVHDRARKVGFFEKTFLLADISMDVALEMPFFNLSNANIWFTYRKLYWRSYTIPKALPTTCCVEFIDQKEFALATLGKNDKSYVVHMAFLAVCTKITIHPSWTAQIASLIADKALVTIFAEYSNFTDVFSFKFAAELSKYTGINDHSIELIDDQQPPYGPIYSLKPVELKTQKTYIEVNLANGFIRPFKSPVGAPILFVQKSDSSFWLCVDYWGLNNLTIKH